LIHNYFENERAWADFSSGLDRLAGIQQREDLCAVVFLNLHLIALDEDHPFTPVYERVANAARERELFPVPSFEAFLGREFRTLWVSPSNSHPNGEGHALLAEALLAGLRRLPERCWTR
jgi:lysophospholipase L1-like esterase